MTIQYLAVLASLSVAVCTATTPPDILTAYMPADPAIGIRDTLRHPVDVDFSRREPVDPQHWRKLNEDLSPARSGAGS